MKCPKCNNSLNEKDKFCAQCGTKVEHIDTDEDLKDKSFASNPFVVLGSVTVIALLIIYLILDSNKIDAHPGNTNETNTEMESSFMKEIGELKNDLSSNPDDVALNIRMANNLFDINRFSDAIKYYKRALRIEPDNENVIIDLGVSYFNLQQSDSAIFEIKRALKLKPDHPQGLFNLGVIYYNTGQNTDARKYWTELIRIHDNSHEADLAKKLLMNIN